MAPQPSSLAQSNGATGTTTSVQVALRIRPSNNHDLATIPPRFQRTIVHAVSQTSVAVDPLSANPAQNATPSPAQTIASKKQQFTFDQVHGPSTTQHAIFTSTANPLISRFLEGFNCTILAYGQTSSGKTHTMTGIDLDADPADPENGMGIIPRAVATIFSRARELREERAGAWNFSLKGSFIEIYNEDLLDLLADEHSPSGRREVQIREDKHGTIIWDGLREIGVKNTPEVMSLLRKGTSIRRTNETDMNAQSSRSHAIFSLTLTQRKYVGTNPLPPRSSSPLPPSGPGRSPSRLARPGSMIAGPSNRVSSPTFGRPGTPSFGSAIHRSSLQGSGLRPPSSLGFHHPDRESAEPGTPGSDGDWVTVVSKFHFVDLAGSERLKRTAAQGERIKEGISINSGLLALGNVISALGDPSRAKSNTASYVPYRDSKLTRLLQDSLGGNAHTLMIACVSPTEWNAAETVNTLKYANRARNIKNRAVVNEREEGWDDIEWLQNMVTRLRKELKGIKEGSLLASAESNAPGSFKLGHTPASSIITVTSTESHTTPASGRMLAQMAELQNNYEDLREQFTQRTEELTRLRRELAEKTAKSPNSNGQMNRYEEIVGPVIEEYEKAISAMEAELSLNRAALRHTNEMFDEKEEELAGLQERHSATEMYVEELRNRAARLTEREASTEAYVRDLEERLRQYDESNLSSSESIGSLKKEITQYKEAETHSSQYIADLESRLLRADESILDLQQALERLEKEADRRREEVEVLQSRLISLSKDGQSWRDDLEEREERVKELEKKMIELETKKQDAAEERARLGGIVEEVAKARRSLQLPRGITINGSGSGVESLGSSRPETPLSTAPPSETPQTVVEGNADTQLLALQQTHTATLADLSAVTAKYRDALREIHDLSSQLEEVKLSQGLAASESPERPGSLDPFSGNASGSPRRKPVRDMSENSGSRRLFFRNAASAESLHSRSLSQSQSLSQELSSANSPKPYFPSSPGSNSPVSHSPSDSFSSRPTLSISVPHSVSLLNGPNGLGGSASGNGKSAASLEKEIMRLQDVLKERENEIALLEESLRATEAKAGGSPTAVPTIKTNGSAIAPPLLRIESGESEEFVTPVADHPDFEVTTPVSPSPIPPMDLSPRMMNQFKAIRRSLDLSGLIESGGEDFVPPSGQDGLLGRLNELMLSMAQKESTHKEVVDDLNTQLSQIKKQHDELQTLSRDQIHNMSAEIEAIGSKHTEALEKLEEVAEREAKLVESLRNAEEAHAAEVEALRVEHTQALRLKEAEVDDLINRLKTEHEQALLERLAAAAADLEQAHQDHAKAFGELKAEHEVELQRRNEEVERILAKEKQTHEESLTDLLASHASTASLKENQYTAVQKRLDEAEGALRTAKLEHAADLEKVVADHTAVLKSKDVELSEAVAKTEEEYYNALTKLRQDHSEAIERQATESSIALERLKEEHTSQLRVAELTKEGSLSESQTAQEKTIRELREAHSQAVSQKEANFAHDLERLRAEHEKALSSTIESHVSVLEKTRLDHATALSKLQAESQAESTRLAKLVEDAKAGLGAFERQVTEKLEASRKEAAEQQVLILQEVERGHEHAINKLKASHQTILQETERKALDEQTKLHQSHMQETERLKSEHDATLAELKAASDASLAQNRQEFETELERQRQSLTGAQSNLVSELESKHNAALLEAREKFENERSTLADTHSREIESLDAKHRLALAEVDDRRAQERTELTKSHELAITQLLSDQLSTSESAQSALAASEDQRLQTIENLRAEYEQNLSQEREKWKASLAELEARRDQELGSLAEELATLRSSSYEAANLREQHSQDLVTKESKLNSVLSKLQDTQAERDDLALELSRLRDQIEKATQEQSTLLKEAAKRQSLVEELEKHRSVLAETQEWLQKARDEKDAIQLEKNKQEAILRDLQAQAIRCPSPPNTTPRSRQTMIPPAKPPPPTPPPSIPPPPTPRSDPISTASPLTTINSMASSRELNLDSPATSLAPSLQDPAAEPKLLQQIDQQTKTIGEQAAMIKTLNKQLTHCESDLQTHMEEVSRLENSLADSEKNLRKARMHATELARERDSLNGQMASLRNELEDAKREVTLVRRSVVEEKQSLENRLDEERRAKERVRAQLDSRMEELQKRKSKFVCL